MPELLEGQRAFAAALREPSASPRAARWMSGDAATVERRLAIYRGNVAASVARALGATYPVVRRVVGDEFFDAMAARYLRAHPSASGDLNDYGAEFPTFLESFPHAQHLPYLADLARLEWAVHVAESAADAPPFDPATLASLASASPESLRVRWAPGTALLESPHPIARVWQIHQADHDGAFSVDWSAAETALVARDGWRVAVTAIAAGDAAFIAASLGAGASLAAATDAALARDAAFDLGALLGRAASQRLITNITIAHEEESPS